MGPAGLAHLMELAGEEIPLFDTLMDVGLSSTHASPLDRVPVQGFSVVPAVSGLSSTRRACRRLGSKGLLIFYGAAQPKDRAVLPSRAISTADQSVWDHAATINTVLVFVAGALQWAGVVRASRITAHTHGLPPIREACNGIPQLQGPL